MTPQTALAQNPGADPVTPVIVKTGGDTGDDDTDVIRTVKKVFIDSSSIPFAETVDGSTWTSSQSTKKGRIRHLMIKDGPNIAEYPINPPSKLASVSFKAGSTQLMAMESGDRDENNVVLLLISPQVPFSVVQNGDWTSSTSATPFPDRLESLTLMVGDEQRLFYDFQSDNVEVQIHFK